MWLNLIVIKRRDRQNEKDSEGYLGGYEIYREMKFYRVYLWDAHQLIVEESCSRELKLREEISNKEEYAFLGDFRLFAGGRRKFL